MAIIYSYPSVTPVVADILLITQASDPSKATKSITLSSLKTLFGLNDSLNGVGTPGYIPIFETSSRLADSLIKQVVFDASKTAVNVGTIPQKGGGVADNPYWIDNFQVEGTLSVSSKVAIGTPRQLENQEFDLNILGEEGKIAFGDNNVFGDPVNNIITWNVVVGEYGTGDTDVLQLHGKEGTRFTNGQFGTASTMTILANGNVEIDNNLTVLGDATFGDDDSTEVTMESTLSLQGPIKDNAGNLGTNGQILVSTGGGSVSWGNPNEGTVKSVGITETGNALTITGSPVTSEGDINIAGAGTASQVILGDLTLTDLPVGTVKGTGTVNFVSKWSAADTLQDSIIFDDGTSVGIGTDDPQDKLEVQGSIYATPVAYSSNEDAYALRMGANSSTAFDMGIKIKSNSAGVPYMSLRSHNTEDLLVLESTNVGIGLVLSKTKIGRAHV